MIRLRLLCRMGAVFSIRLASTWIVLDISRFMWRFGRNRFINILGPRSIRCRIFSIFKDQFNIKRFLVQVLHLKNSQNLQTKLKKPHKIHKIHRPFKSTNPTQTPTPLSQNKKNSKKNSWWNCFTCSQYQSQFLVVSKVTSNLKNARNNRNLINLLLIWSKQLHYSWRSSRKIEEIRNICDFFYYYLGFVQCLYI